MAVLCAAGDTHLSNSLSLGWMPSALEPLSITCWVTFPTTSVVVSMVGAYGPAAPTTAVQIGTRGGGLIDVWTWGAGVLISSTGLTIALNTWYHIAYTFDGTSHRLYVNGVLNNTATTAQLSGQLNQVYINGFPGGGAGETNAHKVDSYAFYNRTLAAAEIQTMAACKGLSHGIFNNLLVAYEFDEGIEGSVVSSVRDLSGNGANLVASGAASTITYTYAGAVASTNLKQVL